MEPRTAKKKERILNERAELERGRRRDDAE